jgi:peptidoglycan/LPS O-acetylase OafA/YrhL
MVSFIAFSCFILITASLFLLTEDVFFPGLRAIPPTIGAAMLIYAGQFGDSLPTRLLKLRPMIWVGLISYSAYLWHWPMLAFYRYGHAEISMLAGTFFFA